MTNTQFLEQNINNDLLIKMGFNWSKTNDLEVYEIGSFQIAYINKGFIEKNNVDSVNNLGYFYFKNAELTYLLDILNNTYLDFQKFQTQFKFISNLGELEKILLENKFSKAEIEKMFEKLY